MSSGFLSLRQRTIRGKRKATPDLCRLLAAIPSKAISKTSSGFTVRTGPNFSASFVLHRGLAMGWEYIIVSPEPKLNIECS